jgi:hypothetical protein
MLLDMQYCHACDMYKSSRDADSSGRKLSEGLAQCKNFSEAAELHSRWLRYKEMSQPVVHKGSITCESRVVT